MELDIELVPTGTLWKIYDLIKRHNPEVEDAVRQQFMQKEASPPPTRQPPSKPKKNKPMSKVEQERKIEQLRQSVQQFERHTSGSQEPMQSKSTSVKLPSRETVTLEGDHCSNIYVAVEARDESSSDEDSSDSEEE